jgi:uncharacterized protein (DUF2236 family)
VGPLDRADLEAFWSEARQVGVRIGIPLEQSPPDWDGLMSYWARMIGEDGPLHVTPTARRLSRSIVRPPIPLVPGPLVDLAVLPSLALVPARIRGAYGLAWGPGRESLVRLLDLGLRAWVRVVPPDWRAMPQARAAERRSLRIGGHAR